MRTTERESYMSNELTTKAEYGVAINGRSMSDVLRENIGGEGLSIYELDSVKVPAGGGTIWTVPTAEGEKGFKEIECVVVAKTMTRAFWLKSKEEGGDGSPDCRSSDTIHGEALSTDGPGGACEKCPKSQFGSASKGRGQACKLQAHLALKIGDDMLPTMLTIPPSGLGAMKKEWLLRLAKVCKPFWSAVTAIGLKTEQNEAGTKYSRPTFRIVRMLSETECAEMADYVESLKGILRTGSTGMKQDRDEGSEVEL